MTKCKTIGIDLGTTYYCVGVYDGNRVQIIPNEYNNNTTPSMITFLNSLVLVGEEAMDMSKIYSENTVYDVKRIIGRDFNDKNLTSDRKYWPFHVIKGKKGKPYIQVEYENKIKNFSPEEISGMILLKLKQDAEKYLGHEVTDAVITVPAFFNNAQRRATIRAGEFAGLRVQRIVNEPTAAAIAYGFNKIDPNEKTNILVVDLGGGTLDISLLSLHYNKSEVKASSGDTHLGGNDFDNRLVAYFVHEFKMKYGKDLTTDPRAIRRLKMSCENLKRKLSSHNSAKLSLDSIVDGIDFNSSITRRRFEELNKDLFEEVIELIEMTIKDSKISKPDIQEIVLVGGSTRIPKIQSLISEYFDGKKINKNINPDEAVACGAAILSASLSKTEKPDKIKDVQLKDVTPMSLGVETVGGIMKVILERNTPIPAKKTKIFTTQKDYQTSICIKIYEGEQRLTKNNNLLGEFTLTNIPPALQGIPKIKETISVDENGILNVSAVETSTGNCKSITIVNNNDVDDDNDEEEEDDNDDDDEEDDEDDDNDKDEDEDDDDDDEEEEEDDDDDDDSDDDDDDSDDDDDDDSDDDSDEEEEDDDDSDEDDDDDDEDEDDDDDDDYYKEDGDDNKDRKTKQRIESRNSLLNYVLELRNTLRNETFKSKIGIKNYKKLKKQVNSTINWTNNNPNASRIEYVNKRYDLMCLVYSIIE